MTASGSDFVVTDPDQLRAMYGSVPKRAAGKVHAPWISTTDGSWPCHRSWCSPPQPQTVCSTCHRAVTARIRHVLTPTRLVLPDRPGNNRIDSMLNVLGDPRISLIFLVPGVGHTLRVNGVATITTDPELLGLGAINGRLPRTALDITAHEVLYQCPRALVRSGLWDATRQVDAAALPSLDEVLAAQVDDLSLEESLRIGRASVDDPLW
jgi:predicted pyridoxine 5'-phosphate oxidase superfamily flavin-nucleotide-binding protein